MSLTASGYHNFLNKEIVVMLKVSFIIGSLKSYDQFGTIILENTTHFRLRNNDLIQQKSPVLMIRGESVVGFGPLLDEFTEDERNYLKLIQDLNKPQPNLVHLGFCALE
eukprot:NODE_417_length_7834_cov_0.489334.p8 type:complete len:109 gc:universal NODE_417_length_7834_cov_0.489334:6282-5956(-)